MLNIKEKTLYQWAEQKQIPHIKLNKCLRFDIEELGAWVASCKITPEDDYNIVAKLEALKGGQIIK